MRRSSAPVMGAAILRPISRFILVCFVVGGIPFLAIPNNVNPVTTRPTPNYIATPPFYSLGPSVSIPPALFVNSDDNTLDQGGGSSGGSGGQDNFNTVSEANSFYVFLTALMFFMITLALQVRSRSNTSLRRP
ncbi:MAG: hypothetical protein NZZ41_00595 [Candidatus Dojkabacteria bacterium]|nr:hypothetical protein [Candidatus Dojkabacteria bacterium]